MLRVTAALSAVLCAAAALSATADFSLKTAAASPGAELFVSPDGDDSNAGTIDAPLKTLAGARDAVRKINGSVSGDIVVNFRGGTYRQTEPVKFDTKDSGK
ncbi:MAG: carbohydrate-binding protein, partial [Oscillospiraceae bacterium]|nr:carbohydrate-binding protein [Oscillospiraceae bacterium]